MRESLDVPYVTQIDDTSNPHHLIKRCGAACAEMVLGSIGAEHPDQIELYDQIRTAGVGDTGSWYSPPRGLTAVLQTVSTRPGTFRGSFSIKKEPGELVRGRGRAAEAEAERVISRQIITTIQERRAPVALVYDGGHWLVVRGYQTVERVTGSGSEVISGFDVNNPSPLAYPHDTTPNPCDKGGIGHICYPRWQDRYLTPVFSFRGGRDYSNRCVAICVDTTVVRPRMALTAPELPAEEKQAAAQAPLSGNAQLINPADAIGRAEAGIKDYELYAREPWRTALQSAQPGNPLLVQELDRLDSYYYIVPWRTQPDNAVMAVTVNAKNGAYQESVCCLNGNIYLPPQLTAKQLAQLVIGKKFLLPGQQGELVVREEALSIYPLLVWRPCLESFSPFRPFYLFIVGAHRLYLRVDGDIFTSLNSNVLGA